MATPYWSESEKRWVLKITQNCSTKKFTSVKTGQAGKREVMRKYREWENNGSVARNKATVQAVWDLFIKDTAARCGADSEAIKQYSKIGRLYILPAIGKKRISTLNKVDYQTIINEARPHNSRTKVLSKKYVSTIRMVLALFIKFSNENGFSEPFLGSLYIPKDRPTVAKEILQPDDLRRLFEPSEKHYHRALCFMVASGLRPSEVLGLQWSDFERDCFTIRRGISTSGKITALKNANAARIIPLNKFLLNILQAQKTATESLCSPWVFCSEVGAQPSQSTLRHHFEELRAERNLPGTLYSLRHTFVSMLKNSLPEQMLKTLVGHSAAMDTFGVYGHTV